MQREIIEFDTTLDDVQKLFPLNTKVGGFIANTRYDLFTLLQAIRGRENINYSRLTEEPWIDFWQRKEEEVI